MAAQHIVTQLLSIRHIVTRGFGTFFDEDFGQAELIELGEALVNRTVEMNAYACHEKELEAHVLSSPMVEVER